MLRDRTLIKEAENHLAPHSFPPNKPPPSNRLCKVLASAPHSSCTSTRRFIPIPPTPRQTASLESPATHTETERIVNVECGVACTGLDRRLCTRCVFLGTFEREEGNECATLTEATFRHVQSVRHFFSKEVSRF